MTEHIQPELSDVIEINIVSAELNHPDGNVILYLPVLILLTLKVLESKQASFLMVGDIPPVNL